MAAKRNGVRYYDSIKPMEIKWLAYPYIPFGKVTVIQGDPGEGKTTMALLLAAYVSRGERIPFGSTEKITGGNVIYQSAEDSPNDTIKPRLMALKADCSKVALIENEAMDLNENLDILKQAIKSEKAKLVCLDPLQAYIGKGSDLNRAGDMRKCMSALARIADESGCAFIVVGHQNKSEGSKSLYRGLGSIDIAAAARSVILIHRDEDDEGIRLLTHIKSSLAPNGETLAFRINKDCSVDFDGGHGIDEENVQPAEESKRDKAADIITEMLSKGELPCSEVYEKCKSLGIGERTVDTVKKELGVKSVRKNKMWYWLFDGQQSVNA